jgi:ABC-type polysaccharide/polyol phosphate export permease
LAREKGFRPDGVIRSNPALSVITEMNPLSYGIDAMRRYFCGTGHFSPFLDVTVLLAATAFFVALGAWLFNGIEV